jgi:hypothetical protein
MSKTVTNMNLTVLHMASVILATPTAPDAFRSAPNFMPSKKQIEKPCEEYCHSILIGKAYMYMPSKTFCKGPPPSDVFRCAPIANINENNISMYQACVVKAFKFVQYCSTTRKCISNHEKSL